MFIASGKSKLAKDEIVIRAKLIMYFKLIID